MSRGAEHPATVLLVDDHPLLRGGLRTLLDCEEDLVVVGEAGDGEQAVTQARTLRPDLVVMDISMPRLNGIEATRLILADAPATRVVALSIHSEERFVNGMLQAGAAGYVLKDSVPEELVQAIRAVLRGEGFLSAPLLGTVISGLQSPAVVEAAPVAEDAPVAQPLPVLQTKLYRPAPPADLVPRGRLLEQLDAGRERPLTLVSAPAGYGKSTLLASWLDENELPSAWISLDSDDSGLRQFLMYLVAAVKRIFPEACEESQALAGRRQLPPIDTVATTLANELESLEQPFALVLDDYHNVSLHSQVNELLQQLLHRPPLPLHLVIIARHDPPLSLVSLRAAGRMTEIRLRDLRFTTAEARSLVEKNMSFVASDEAIATLERQVEGWAAGLRLVSLASRQADNPESFLLGLRGGVQQTREFLTEEVINKQPQDLRDWLLKCSILERFCAPLCEVLCSEEAASQASTLDGTRFIEAVRGGNLFAVPLDAHGEWFRFQHLFHEMLQRELARRFRAGEITALHARASEWFERSGYISGAIRHALEAGEATAAAEIVERCRLEWQEQGRWIEIQRWLKKIPEETVHRRPQLLLARAWCLFEAFHLHEIPAVLDEVEALITDEEADAAVCCELDLLRGCSSFWNGDGEAALDRLEAAERRSPPSLEVQGLLHLHLSLARQMTGRESISLIKESRRVHAGVPGVQRKLRAAEASVHLLGGDLALAAQAALRMPTAAENMGPDAVWRRYLLANSSFQAHAVEEALQSFQKVVESSDSISRKAAIDAMAGVALSAQALQKPEAAKCSAEELLDLAREIGSPEHLEIAESCRARLALLQGDLDAAIAWAESHRVSYDPSGLFFWVEVACVTHARVLIASSTPAGLEQAGELLAAMLCITEKLHNHYQTIQLQVLRALMLHKQGKTKQALEILQQTMTPARAGGWIRPFVEAGPEMTQLLGRLEEQPDGQVFFLRLLTACDRQVVPEPTGVPSAPQTQASPAARVVRSPASGRPELDALTNRELDILELLVRRLQNKEIASRLCISMHTVNDHLKHIYQKLGVSGRRNAVKRAAEIGLISR